MAKRKSDFRKMMKKFWKNQTAVLGAALLIMFIIIAIFAPQIVKTFAPKAAARAYAENPYQMPRVAWTSNPLPPSKDDPFGVIGGRDIFYGVIYGTRTAFKLGLTVAGLSALIGIFVGSISAYFGGWVDEILMRIVDIFMSIPFLVAAMVLTTILGKGLDKVMIALVVFGWMTTARLIRGNILQAREEQYVLAAKALGQKDWLIIIKHILPNTIFPVVIQMSMRMGSYVITAAGLSFLGVGAEPGYADWGTILSYSRNWMTMLDKAWFAIVFPGVAMVLFVLAWNLVGDALRDIFDPRMRS
ncbi:peptide ABC transporter permease [Kosmotoga arenicorallina S304]|uniref:Peptide ABC transporter permease n=1 Tax=Kosmotoga arenicorallina S304 TaxID=1453497 RepID=A0A182C7N6_9BACT|nr:ABC transporter permease [Kosmotoga arenicorallina]OAA31317.1 peptide ABC transporter permease [Kosmotoga arenicorallina S304]